MNSYRSLLVGLLGLLCALLTGCGPKVDMAPVAGIWANADHSRIVILDSDRGITYLSLARSGDSGAAYVGSTERYKIKAADHFEASPGDTDLSFRIPAGGQGTQVMTLALTQTMNGKPENHELRRLTSPVVSVLNAMGLATSGKGTLSVRAQPELAFYYVRKEQNGVSYYSLTATDRPELRLHFFAGKDSALCALIHNRDDDNAYMMTFAAQKGDNDQLSLTPVAQGEASNGLRFSVSSNQESLSIREI